MVILTIENKKFKFVFSKYHWKGCLFTRIALNSLKMSSKFVRVWFLIIIIIKRVIKHPFKLIAGAPKRFIYLPW